MHKFFSGKILIYLLAAVMFGTAFGSIQAAPGETISHVTDRITTTLGFAPVDAKPAIMIDRSKPPESEVPKPEVKGERTEPIGSTDELLRIAPSHYPLPPISIKPIDPTIPPVISIIPWPSIEPTKIPPQPTIEPYPVCRKIETTPDSPTRLKMYGEMSASGHGSAKIHAKRAETHIKGSGLIAVKRGHVTPSGFDRSYSVGTWAIYVGSGSLSVTGSGYSIIAHDEFKFEISGTAAVKLNGTWHGEYCNEFIEPIDPIEPIPLPIEIFEPTELQLFEQY